VESKESGGERKKGRDDGEFVVGRIIGIGEDGRAEGRETQGCREIWGARVERMGNGVGVGWGVERLDSERG
jgi:hypothetical protein